MITWVSRSPVEINYIVEEKTIIEHSSISSQRKTDLFEERGQSSTEDNNGLLEMDSCETNIIEKSTNDSKVEVAPQVQWAEQLEEQANP